jgi:hypothetical protein
LSLSPHDALVSSLAIRSRSQKPWTSAHTLIATPTCGCSDDGGTYIEWDARDGGKYEDRQNPLIFSRIFLKSLGFGAFQQQRQTNQFGMHRSALIRATRIGTAAFARPTRTAGAKWPAWERSRARGRIDLEIVYLVLQRKQAQNETKVFKLNVSTRQHRGMRASSCYARSCGTGRPRTETGAPYSKERSRQLDLPWSALICVRERPAL